MASASAKLQVNTQDTSKPTPVAEAASPRATVEVPQPVTPEPSPSKKRPELRPQTKTPKNADKAKDKEVSPAKPLRETSTPNKAPPARSKGWDKKVPTRPEPRKDDKGRDDNRRGDRNDRIERRRDDRRPNQHENSNNWERQKKERTGYNSDDRGLLSDKPLAPVHPLQCSWMFWLSLPQGVTQTNDRKNRWESNLKELGSNFNSVEHFWGYVHHMEVPSRLEYNSSYYLFKSGIKPMWEYEDNVGGGKWVVQLKGPDHVDEVWQNVMLAIVGEAFDAAGDAITGAVVNRRRAGTGSKGSRVAVWLRKTSEEVIAELGEKIKAAATDGLDIDVACSFSVHNTEPPTPLGGE